MEPVCSGGLNGKCAEDEVCLHGNCVCGVDGVEAPDILCMGKQGSGVIFWGIYTGMNMVYAVFLIVLLQRKDKIFQLKKWVPVCICLAISLAAGAFALGSNDRNKNQISSGLIVLLIGFESWSAAIYLRKFANFAKAIRKIVGQYAFLASKHFHRLMSTFGFFGPSAVLLGIIERNIFLVNIGASFGLLSNLCICCYSTFLLYIAIQAQIRAQKLSPTARAANNMNRTLRVRIIQLCGMGCILVLFLVIPCLYIRGIMLFSEVMQCAAMLYTSLRFFNAHYLIIMILHNDNMSSFRSRRSNNSVLQLNLGTSSSNIHKISSTKFREVPE